MAKTSLLLTLLLAAMLTADLATAAAADGREWPDVAHVLRGALLSSQSAILGVWIALARRPLALRLLTGLAILSVGSAAWLGIDWMQFLGLQAGLVALFLTALRWLFGFALGHIDDDRKTADPKCGWQLSILDLLVLTTVASVWLGVNRFQPIEQSTFLAWLGYQIPLAVVTCGASGLILAGRFDSARPYQTLTLAGLVGCTPIWINGLWPCPDPVQSQAALLQLGIASGLVSGSLWTFRCAGYRIVWRAQPRYDAAGAAAAGCAAAAGAGGAAGGGLSVG